MSVPVQHVNDAHEEYDEEQWAREQAERNRPDAGWGDDISRELCAFLASNSSTFSCGGTIRIVCHLILVPPLCRFQSANEKRRSPKTNKDTNTVSGSASDTDDSIATTTPFALRWDSNQDRGRKITFPVTGENGKVDLAALQQDCEPASFGYQGKDVHDETYRKAFKMDRSAFSSDFCPYELGIVNTIAQVLLPERMEGIFTTGVRAELYKLNIYSAPSGFFKSHVDTPRSETQFGSLVVSLPCHHEGGELIVRHAGHSVTFDWGTTAVAAAGLPANSIHWAAFYSDCEHEVKELTAGHRVTLTYNLYYDLGVGDLAAHAPALQASSLPLYEKVRDALAAPTFLPQGGILGMFCTHAYAHNIGSAAAALPGVLKGADMALYAVFRALGLRVDVRAVFSRDGNCEDEDDEDEEDPGFNTHVGRRLGELVVTHTGGSDCDGWDRIWEQWPNDKLTVCWLTKPGSDDLQQASMVHMTYGNNAGIGAIYTRLATLVCVGPSDNRGDAPDMPKREQAPTLTFSPNLPAASLAAPVALPVLNLTLLSNSELTLIARS
ncbi:hypothetical protein C8A05DRAFT_33419 [Staphylotrichum tortipilum]|uniref:Fe2OG dioxygenase domain-containing protein n=1 Tax=Staphylotrichum tortipilum TaxID=2831512 RepID=A0AAN6MKY8_9PEZI|nr:hypothetical protein C8A05DRAFT_33419 [Staphylotrichum longicolle]